MSFSQEKEKTTTPANIDSVYVMTKSPWLAIAQSAILPGLGQFYNHSYWKIPIVWGVTGWFIYNYIQVNKDYRNYANLTLTNPSYRGDRDFYHDERDLFAI